MLFNKYAPDALCSVFLCSMFSLYMLGFGESVKQLLTYIRYAVGRQTGRLCPIMARFVCGSMVFFIFVSKTFAQSANVLEKDRSSTMLPQAKLASRSGTRPEQSAPRKSCNVQELRGRFHPQASAWTTGPLRLRQGGMGHSFSGTCGSERHMFRKKTKTSHAAAGEIRRYREQTNRLLAHRVSRVIQIWRDRPFGCLMAKRSAHLPVKICHGPAGYVPVCIAAAGAARGCQTAGTVSRSLPSLQGENTLLRPTTDKTHASFAIRPK